jgi:hypothetical protein
LNAWDITADALVGASRVLDYTSTRAFLTPKPLAGCPTCPWKATGHEIEIPNVVAKNPAALASFEVGTTAAQVYGERYLIRHGHARIARISQFTAAGLTLGTDVRNYRIAAEKWKVR